MIIIFFIAFILNLIWENAHSFLYTSYQGGKITEFILIRASLFDALIITLVCIPFLYVEFLKKRPQLIVPIGIIIAIINEWYGLGTGHWTYNELMPIIPIIKTGLTPSLQLGILGYVTYSSFLRERCLENR